MAKRFVLKRNQADPKPPTKKEKREARLNELRRQGFGRFCFVFDQETFDRFVRIHCQNDEPNVVLGKILAQYAGEEFRKPPSRSEIDLAIFRRGE